MAATRASTSSTTCPRTELHADDGRWLPRARRHQPAIAEPVHPHADRRAASAPLKARKRAPVRAATRERRGVNAATNASLGKFKSLFASVALADGLDDASFDIIRVDDLRSLGCRGPKRSSFSRDHAVRRARRSSVNVDGVTFQSPSRSAMAASRRCSARVRCRRRRSSRPTGERLQRLPDGLVHCCMGPSGLVCPPTTVEQFMLTVTKAGANGATATVHVQPSRHRLRSG